MYVSSENNNVLQLKTEAGIERQYHVLCSNNMERYKIFLSNSPFRNLRYTYIALYKII